MLPPITAARITLGPLGNGHLGDVLCTSPLPRLLTLHRKVVVQITDHPMLRDVFKCNPYVAGIGTGPTILPGQSATGDGHVLQRVLQGLELPLDPHVKPEVYLDPLERKWAAEERRRYTLDKPICLVSAGAITDRGNLNQVDWPSVVQVLNQRYTVLQAVHLEAEIPGAVVYSDLPLRKYMALFSVADCFFGGTSGGSHLAAAFEVPAVVVIWRALQRELRFPVSGLGITAAFLYPRQWFVAAEDLALGACDSTLLNRLLDEVHAFGRSGRPTSIGLHPRNPCGFMPVVPVRLAWSGVRRIVKRPGTYGTPASWQSP